ncbi:MAG: hypothetical protein AAGB34_05020 [Planctomycetota bacterium]
MSAAPVNQKMIFADENISLAATPPLSGLLAIIGGILTLAAILGGFVSDPSIALHALHTGFLLAIGFPLGALVLTMILHATGAGWAGSIRRQLENMMSLIWVGFGFFILVVLLQIVYNTFQFGETGKYAPYLWNWMNPVYVEGDALIDGKRPFLNEIRFGVFHIVYALIWVVLISALIGYSKAQDRDGDPKHTVKASRLSCIGLPLFAFSVAFASYDWIMALDFHWFSTMFGVYFFCGCIVSAIALTLITMLVLRGTGKVAGAFTDEHLHDLSKLMFAFIVFWGYITFSQYFLIWYANIPEETMFFASRKDAGTTWHILSWAIPIGHFIVPFLLILPRPARRNPAIMLFVAAWMIVFHILDWYWLVRPEVHNSTSFHPLDVAGIGGPMLLFLGLYMQKVASGPLIPLRDPRTNETLAHKNYV